MNEDESTIFERAHRVGDYWPFFQTLDRLLKREVEPEFLQGRDLDETEFLDKEKQ